MYAITEGLQVSLTIYSGGHHEQAHPYDNDRKSYKKKGKGNRERDNVIKPIFLNLQLLQDAFSVVFRKYAKQRCKALGNQVN